MSSFSSVVQKPGRKIVPRAAPRRNAPRNVPAKRASPTPTPAPPSVDLDNEDAQDLSATSMILHQESDVGQDAQDEVVATGSATDFVTNGQLGSSDIAHNVESVNNTTALESEILAESQHQQHITSGHDRTVAGAQRGSGRDASPTSGFVEDTALTQDTMLPLLGSVDEESSSPSISHTGEETHTATNLKAQLRRSARKSNDQSGSRKRRKLTPEAANEGGPMHTYDTSSALPIPIPSPQPSTLDTSTSTNPDDLLQSALRNATSVSKLASDIEMQTQQLQRHKEGSLVSDTATATSRGTSDILSPRSAQQKQQRKRNIQKQAAEVVANALGKAKVNHKEKMKGHMNGRDGTPEGAEDYELEPAKITMGELCEDRKLGKKSTLETEMQANWAEILQRRREDRERALTTAEKRRRTGFISQRLDEDHMEAIPALAAVMTVVNGVIVVDQASREIDRSAVLQRAAVQDADNVREDLNYFKYVNSGTVGMKPGHGRHSKWNEETNERFFKGLRMFGTDFLMIANMFPGFTRKQIKMKFIREENANKARILECLRNREAIDLEDYAELANQDSTEYCTLDSIQKELDEQEQRLRDEDNQKRKRGGLTTNDNNDNNDGGGGDEQQVDHVTVEDAHQRQTTSIEPGRFDSMAREIVEAAAGSKKKQRKANSGTSRRGQRGGRHTEGGIEEILGSITEVAV